MMNYHKRRGKIATRELFTSFTVLWLIISSGSEYFMNQHMPLTTAIMGVLSAVLIVRKPKLTAKHKNVLNILIAFMVFNTLANFSNGIYFNDVVIDIVKIVFVVSIANTISEDEFIVKYVRIMFCLAILSLICHAFIQITHGGPLPFQQAFIGSNGLRRYSTFYHTVGWELNYSYHTAGYGYFTRNAGIFWEPGGYQVFLNLALFLFWAKQELFELLWTTRRRKRLYKMTVPILIITILSTQSTTGYICLIFNILFYLFYKNKVKSSWSKVLIIMGGVVAIVVIEASTNVIGDKLFNHTASYFTRLNDTIEGFTVVLNRWFLGYGLFAKETISSVLLSHGIINISNGINAFALNVGLVGLVLYVIRIGTWFNRICKKEILCFAIAFGNFLVMSSSESIFMAPVFLLLFISFRQINNLKREEKGIIRTH